MLTAVVTVSGTAVEVRFPAQEVAAEEEEVPESDLNPIAPELKEIAWGFGSFVVFAVLMRWFLYPRLRRGMDARYRLIKGGHDEAEQITESARSAVAEYEEQLVAIRAEAAGRVDAARKTLEGERAERLEQVNARIAERRAAAQADVDAAREAASSQVEAAVADVASRAVELATGRAPDPEVVQWEVAATTREGVGR